MNERGDNMQRYHDGQFSRMEGERLSDEELADANKRLREKRLGKGEDGIIDIPEETETNKEAK